MKKGLSRVVNIRFALKWYNHQNQIGVYLMKWNQSLILSSLIVFGSSAFAGQIDGSAVLGSAVGAAAGSAIGSATGGRDGAIIGGGIGGALGAAAGSQKEPVRTSGGVVVVGDGYHDNGLHKGQHKHRHKHQNGKY